MCFTRSTVISCQVLRNTKIPFTGAAVLFLLPTSSIWFSTEGWFCMHAMPNLEEMRLHWSCDSWLTKQLFKQRNCLMNMEFACCLGIHHLEEQFNWHFIDATAVLVGFHLFGELCTSWSFHMVWCKHEHMEFDKFIQRLLCNCFQNLQY